MQDASTMKGIKAVRVEIIGLHVFVRWIIYFSRKGGLFIVEMIKD